MAGHNAGPGAWRVEVRRLRGADSATGHFAITAHPEVRRAHVSSPFPWNPTVTAPDRAPAVSRYNGSTAPQLASEAERALRGIVHLTEARETSLDPVELFRTLSALTRLVEQLPEAVTRISAQLTSWRGTDGLVVAAGRHYGDPDGAIEAMNDAVREQVIPALGRLRTGLGHAQASVNQLSLS